MSSRTTTSPRPCCRQPKGAGKYLCYGCWGNLPGPARQALSRRDSKAIDRLQELYRRVAAGVPLAEIQVAP